MYGDKKGPENMGPETGRGLGYCAGNDAPGYVSNEAPQGMRRDYCPGVGRGIGSGYGRGFNRGMRGFSGRRIDPVKPDTEITERLDRLEKMILDLKNKEDL